MTYVRPELICTRTSLDPSMTRKASHSIVALSAANALPFNRQNDCGRLSMCVIAKGYLSTKLPGPGFRKPD
jgi:hypothetical protein